MGPFGRQRACALRIWLIRRFIDMKWIDVNSDDSLQLLSLSLCHALSSGFHVGRSKNSSLGKWIESGLHWILDCYLRERSCASTGGLSCNEPPLSTGARTHSLRNSFFVLELRVMWADMLNIAQYYQEAENQCEWLWILSAERLEELFGCGCRCIAAGTFRFWLLAWRCESDKSVGKSRKCLQSICNPQSSHAAKHLWPEKHFLLNRCGNLRQSH